jgi:hypothetical protein
VCDLEGWRMLHSCIPRAASGVFSDDTPVLLDIRSCTVEPTSSTHGLGQGKWSRFQWLCLSANVTQEQRVHSLEIRVTVGVCDAFKRFITLEKAVGEPFKGFSSSPRLKAIPQSLHKYCFFAAALQLGTGKSERIHAL